MYLIVVSITGATPLCQAHSNSDSYLRLVVDNVIDNRLTGQWDIAIGDLAIGIELGSNRDNHITWQEIQSQSVKIQANLSDSLAL